MAILSPSILSADFANLERDIHNIEENGADWVHVDVMDGLFVPNITIGLPVVRDIRKVTKLPLDVHLMIDRPIRYAEGFRKAGENTLACLEKIRAMGGKAGLALKPGTPAEAAVPYLTKCDMLLVMTVEPGFGGQSFLADMMEKTRFLREKLDEVNPGCHIQVDGGIDEKTQAVCKENGVDVFVTGSAYFKAKNRAEFVRMLQA